MVRRALFVGRFQPVHLGHLKVIKEMLDEYDEVVIGMGSAQEDYTLKNPFTANERADMIRVALANEKLEVNRVRIVEMPDIPTNSAWAVYAAGFCPEFQILWTGSPWVALLFTDAGQKVKIHELLEREKYSSTEVRDRMLSGGNWKELVTPGVASYIEKKKVPERLKITITGDNPHKKA